MAKHFQGRTENGESLTQWPAIHYEAAKYPVFSIAVFSEDEAITDRQRRWYKGVCLRGLVKADENCESQQWWDREVKRECDGLALLKKDMWLMEDGVELGRLTTNGVSRKKMTQFIENILSVAITKNWAVYPPDSDLRRTQ